MVGEYTVLIGESVPTRALRRLVDIAARTDLDITSKAKMAPGLRKSLG